MSPITHLLASWIVAAKTTYNPRDCRLVTLAGILPDADGLGMALDLAGNAIWKTNDFHFYQEYHHWWFHGVFGAMLAAGMLACFANARGRVLLLCLLTFHLHLLCDLAGSRGPEPGDMWAIFYLGPFSRQGMYVWSGQWRLDGWQNRVITVALLLGALWMALWRNDSVVGVLNRRADRVFLGVLKKWRNNWLQRKTGR